MLAETTNTPAWLEAAVMVLGVIITTFLVPWLRRKTEAAKAEAAERRAGATKHELESKQDLTDMLKLYALEAAADIAERRFPILAQKIVNKELQDAAAIKAELYGWGKDLKQRIVDHFDLQGVNIVKALGSRYVEEIVEWAANKVSPFPGQETAKALLGQWGGKAAEWLLNRGVVWVRSRSEHELESGE